MERLVKYSRGRCINPLLKTIIWMILRCSHIKHKRPWFSILTRLNRPFIHIIRTAARGAELNYFSGSDRHRGLRDDLRSELVKFKKITTSIVSEYCPITLTATSHKGRVINVTFSLREALTVISKTIYHFVYCSHIFAVVTFVRVNINTLIFIIEPGYCILPYRFTRLFESITNINLAPISLRNINLWDPAGSYIFFNIPWNRPKTYSYVFRSITRFWSACCACCAC